MLDDADFAERARQIGAMTCTHGGQGCAITTRLLLPRSRYDEGRRDRARRRSSSWKYGDPTNPAHLQGPQISEAPARARARLHREGQAGRRALVAGGGVPKHLPKGYYVEPTLFVDVDPKSTIAQEEIFGPVLVRDSVRGRRRRGAHRQRLDLRALGRGARARARSARSRSRAASAPGTLAVNGGMWFAVDTPFGGYRQSGVGRENGVAGFEEYLETKVIGCSAARRVRRWSTTRSPTRSTTIRIPSTAGCATTRPCITTSAHDFWALTRFDDVLARSSTRDATAPRGTSLEFMDQPTLTRGLMIFMDPPAAQPLPQARLEGVHAAPDRRARAARSARIAAEYLDALVGRERFDVVKEFTARLPMDVISSLLGIPRGGSPLGAARRRTGCCTATRATRCRAPRRSRPTPRLLAYFDRADRRAPRAPRDDMMTRLLAGRSRGRGRRARAAHRRGHPPRS